MSINNPFNYSDLTIKEIENLLQHPGTIKQCGNGMRIKYKRNMYIVCDGCKTIISATDLTNIINNRDITDEKQSISFDYLASHGIFRCQEHEGDSIPWTIQCLMKNTSQISSNEEINYV